MKIAIIGRGLIGGSLAKAAIRAGHDASAYDKGETPRVEEAEVVFVAVPPSAVVEVVDSIVPRLRKGAVVVDMTGVKGFVWEALKKYALSKDFVFVGGHPMAGRERTGWANSSADLFDGASMILTPYEWTPTSETKRLKSLLLEIGFAKCVETTTARHDEMIAYTSQLAHVVSSAYVRDGLAKSHDGFSAGSFQDMTRVATLDPELWTDLFLSNRAMLDGVLTRLIDRLSGYRDAIRSSDAAKLKALLAEGRATKGELQCR